MFFFSFCVGLSTGWISSQNAADPKTKDIKESDVESLAT